MATPSTRQPARAAKAGTGAPPASEAAAALAAPAGWRIPIPVMTPAAPAVKAAAHRSPEAADRVAEAQIDRSARLARRLREEGDRAVGPGSPEKALDATERGVFRTFEVPPAAGLGAPMEVATAVDAAAAREAMLVRLSA